MVIEKILKVNSTNPKVDELRAKLAQVQQKTAPAQTTPAAAVPTGVAPTPPPAAKDDLNKLAQLSLEEQKNFAERNNPEIRLREERTNHLIMNQIKELITLNNEATKRIKDLENKNAELQKQIEGFKEKNEDTIQKMNSIDSRLEKFMGLYELITNQYNPFAESLPRTPPKPAERPATPPPPPPPKQEAEVFKVEDTITKQAAAVEIKKEDAQVAQHNFKRVEELLEQLQIKKEAKDAAPLPSAPPPALTSELHSLLAGFEDRLKQQFDKSLQEKLHQGFAVLEQSLQAEIRDALKAEIEQVQQDDSEVQKALNELQALMQASETKNRAPVEEELSYLTSGISHFRDEVRTLPPNMYFRVADGTILKDVKDLREAMRAMPADVFGRHVSSGRNDFADWTEHALLMPELAQLLRKATTPQAAFEVITAHDGLPNT